MPRLRIHVAVFWSMPRAALCLEGHWVKMRPGAAVMGHPYRRMAVGCHLPLVQRGTSCCAVTGVLVLVLHRGAVTVSSAGPRGLFKGMTTATSGVIARFPLLLPVRNSVASYGASAVTRTSDRGHVVEVKNQCHRSGGVSIRVSKETFLPLNVQPVFSF